MKDKYSSGSIQIVILTPATNSEENEVSGMIGKPAYLVETAYDDSSMQLREGHTLRVGVHSCLWEVPLKRVLSPHKYTCVKQWAAYVRVANLNLLLGMTSSGMAPSINNICDQNRVDLLNIRTFFPRK